MLEARTIPTASRRRLHSATERRPRHWRSNHSAAPRRAGTDPRPPVGALAVAAEFVTEGTLHRLREISQGPASLVITRRRRAVALGLTPRADLFGATATPSLSNFWPL